MRKKLLYIIPILLLLLGLLGPAIFSNSTSKTNAPPEPGGSVSRGAPALPGSSTVDVSGETGQAAGPTAGASAENNQAGQTPTVAATTGQGKIEGNSTKGSTPIPAPGESAAPSPASPPAGETVPVDIAVVGKNGEPLFGPATVKVAKKSPYGVTALGALTATFLSFEPSARYPDLIESVAGIRNKGQSGWVYNVNGEFAMVAAGKKPLVAGDKLIWWYSKSIDAPPPDWGQLKRN